MKPLSELSVPSAQQIEWVLFDLDDTLLDHGKLHHAAYRALFDLVAAGLRLVAVTGRPAAFAEVAARQWPIAAAIAENGAVGFLPHGSKWVRVVRDGQGLAARKARLDGLARVLSNREPQLQLADDCHLRVTDVAFDVGEHVSLAADVIQRGADFLREAGARVTVSSVHLHGSFEPDDKASGSLHLLGTHFGVDAGKARSCCAYVGDSGNDGPCFSFFDLTFGVANVCDALGRLTRPPAFVAKAPRGAGFAEVAGELIAKRLAR